MVWGGCEITRDVIIAKLQSERSDIFEEIQEPGPPPKGWMDLELQVSEESRRENNFSLDHDYCYI